MNGVMDAQFSRNDWSGSRRMLHERIDQSIPAVPEPLDQSSVFVRLEQQMAEAETEFSLLAEQLASNYVFRTPGEVRSFLRSHRGTPSIILEATPYLREAFGDVPIVLDVATEEGASRTIYVLAMWKADRTSAREALKKFDHTWWLKNLSKAAGKVVFDYELV